MSTHKSPWIVETQWLASHLDAPDIVVLDGSWHLPNAGRNAKAEFAEQRIPGAVFFDINEISDTSSSLPHMLPSPEKFSSCLRKLGIGNGARVVVYDTAGLFSAARIWWMFRIMGHNDVAILNGGLPKWNAENLPLEGGPARKRRECHFTARFQPSKVKSLDYVLKAVRADNSPQIVDARAAKRFAGSAPEPRPELKSGHIPGSYNVPYNTLLEDDGTLKSPEGIKQAFLEGGVDPGKPIITSCGSGVTAAVLVLGLELIGKTKSVALFDGSWAQWGTTDGVPIETGS
jgi:thiosulfate/3-mercaptopyruvate sulfurtransferase